MLHAKFFFAVFWLILWLISTYLGLIFYITDYADVLQLEKIKYHDEIFLQHDIILQKKSYNLLVKLINILSLSTTLIVVYSFISRNRIKQELSIIAAELGQILQIIFRLLLQLTKIEKATFSFILVLIVLVRIYYLKQHSFTTDEVASYDYFVTQGPLAVTSFYPFTNNHILSNLFCLISYQFSTEPLLTMRVPTFLVSLMGTIIMYIVLIRYCGFAVATLSIGILSLSQVGIFYAIAGRGYFLLTVLTFIGFFSMLNIMYKRVRIRLYWFLYIFSSILGFYTVPTFLYPFTSTLLVGLFCFLWHRKQAEVFQLIVSSFIIGWGTIILYLPLIFITGVNFITNIEFIQPLNSNSFWFGFSPYLIYTEGWLMGQERLGKYLLLGVLMLYAVKIFYFKEKGILLEIGLPSLGLVVIPYFLMVLQQIQVPERALFYKEIYLYLVSSYLLFNILNALNTKERYNIYLIGLIIILYSSYQIYHTEKILAHVRTEERQRKETFQWLINYKPRNVLVLNPKYALFLNHYFKAAKINCEIYTEKKEDRKYDLVILSKNKSFESASPSMVLGKKIYQNNFVQVYGLKTK